MRSSVKPSDVASDNLIDRTRQVWQPRTRHELSCEDARQIAENVTGFFALLAEWSRAEMSSPASDIGKTAAPSTEEGRHER